MYKERFLKRAIIPIGFVMSVLMWKTEVVRAQVPEAPLVPVNVEFRALPHYFEQSISDDARYARIEALLDENGCDVILLDKTTNREALYSFSKRRVEARTANGSDAYTAAAHFAASWADDSSPALFIEFQDRFGNQVSWKFVAGEIVPHASPEVISRSDNSGIILLYAPRRAPSAEGTILTIAGREYLPGSTKSDGAPAAFYANDMTVGQIFPGTDLWAVGPNPADVMQATAWRLSGDGGRLRTLTVKEQSATEASVEQFDPNDPDAPVTLLDIIRVNDVYELRSLSFESHFNTLWIFFGPSLPLPSRNVEDKTIVTFTIAENEQANVASGQLEIQRAVDAEHVSWHFETPSIARGILLETGVNSVPNARAQANCLQEACLDLLK